MEVLADLHRAEVRVERAVGPSGDGDELSAEHVRIALAGGLWQRLEEGEMIVEVELLARLIAAKHAQIALASLCAAVATKDSFQIHARMRVAI